MQVNLIFLLPKFWRYFYFFPKLRTDSETTDEQCIPESISEEIDNDDSAIDENSIDIDDEQPEIEDEEEELASPNDERRLRKLPGFSVNQMEVRESSTESDKTVLSMSTVLEHKDSLPDTPGLLSQTSLPLPEIVVEEHTSPPSSELKSSLENVLSPSTSLAKLHFPKASSVPPLSNNSILSW